MTRDFRPRYILFSITADTTVLPIQRHEMIAALKSYCQLLFGCSVKNKNIFLTRFNGVNGIVRCQHTEKQHTIRLLQSIQTINHKPVQIQTIATSGTIKSLIQKYDNDHVLANK